MKRVVVNAEKDDSGWVWSVVSIDGDRRPDADELEPAQLDALVDALAVVMLDVEPGQGLRCFPIEVD